MLHPPRGLPRSSIWLAVSESWVSSMLGLGRCVDDVVGLRGRTTWLDGYIKYREGKSQRMETTLAKSHRSRPCKGLKRLRRRATCRTKVGKR